MKNNRLLGLEILRFFAAISVLIWHYQQIQTVNFVKENQPFYCFLYFFYNYGAYGVQVFWAISGFIFFMRYNDEINKKICTAKIFLINRFTRLYPLHFLTLVLVLFLQLFYKSNVGSFFVTGNIDIKHFILNLFLASDWGFQNGHSFNGPIWSVSVEVVVYFYFFILAKYFGNNINLIFVTIILSYFLKYLKIHNPIIDCLIYFYIGGLVYIIKNKYDRKILKYSFLFILFAYSIIAYKFNLIDYHYFGYFNTIIVVPILLYLLSSNFNFGSNLNNLIQLFGNLTYSSYLIHFPIQIIIVSFYYIIELQIPFYSPFFFIAINLFTLICSFYIFTYFELKSQRFLRNKFL